MKEDFYDDITRKMVLRQRRFESFKLLFNEWKKMDNGAPLFFITYYPKKNLLQEMLDMFIEEEMYDECAIIRDWIIGVDFLVEKKETNKI